MSRAALGGALPCFTPQTAAAVMSCLREGAEYPGGPKNPAACEYWLARFANRVPCEPAAPVPACRSAGQSLMFEYCRQHGALGPDGNNNAQCWLYGRYPGWFAAVLALPACEGGPEGEAGAGDEEDGGGSALLWVGLGVLALGGLYLATRKR